MQPLQSANALQQRLLSLLASLSAAAASHHSFGVLLSHKCANMKERASLAAMHAHDANESVLAALGRVQLALRFTARARGAAFQQLSTKAAEDHEALATLLDAGAAMSENRHANLSLVLTTLSSLDKLAQSMDGDGAKLCVPVNTLLQATLFGMTILWRELPDGAASTVSGRGVTCFASSGAGAAHNLVLVHPRLSCGTLAEYVKPDDVQLFLEDDSGLCIDVDVTVGCAAGAGLQLTYAVSADQVRKLNLSITVCGVSIGPTFEIHLGYNALSGTRRVDCFEVGRDAFGMAVHVDPRARTHLMAVSFDPKNQVHVIRMTPPIARLQVIGETGAEPANFSQPWRLCFADDGTMLVCDCNNHRVQRLTVAGEHLSSFDVKWPISIAVHGDTIAVGTDSGDLLVEIHSLTTGARIRCFGSRSLGSGQIGGYAIGLRFTLDGSCILVAEADTPYVSLFTVAGLFLKRIGAGVLASGWKDVAFSAAGEIIVADSEANCICVFSSDGETLLKTWFSESDDVHIRFVEPFAIAVAGPRLYVMDNDRVQVFE